MHDHYKQTLDIFVCVCVPLEALYSCTPPRSEKRDYENEDGDDDDDDDRR